MGIDLVHDEVETELLKVNNRRNVSTTSNLTAKYV